MKLYKQTQPKLTILDVIQQKLKIKKLRDGVLRNLLIKKDGIMLRLFYKIAQRKKCGRKNQTENKGKKKHITMKINKKKMLVNLKKTK